MMAARPARVKHGRPAPPRKRGGAAEPSRLGRPSRLGPPRVAGVRVKGYGRASTKKKNLAVPPRMMPTSMLTLTEAPGATGTWLTLRLEL